MKRWSMWWCRVSSTNPRTNQLVLLVDWKAKTIKWERMQAGSVVHLSKHQDAYPVPVVDDSAELEHFATDWVGVFMDCVRRQIAKSRG